MAEPRLESAGWQLRRYYFDGRPPEPDPLTACRGRSLAYCQRLRALWEQICFNTGDFDLAIEPVGGWPAVDSDQLAVLVYGLVKGEVPPEAALAQLRAMIPDDTPS